MVSEVNDPYADEHEAGLQQDMRAERDRLLKDSDWTQVADAPVNRQEWATYRQALRDFPATWEPSEIAVFPEPPQ